MEYTEADLVKLAKRENNKKRNYLLVNPMQGKHVPVSPTKALRLFDDLADNIRKSYEPEKLLLVGFAETATAIGAELAVSLGAEYIQTTREIIAGADYLFFSEEHSHATEQKLVKDDMDRVLPGIDRIVFVDDELTTGKTILNIISILEKRYPKKIEFSVASILNGMNEENFQVYKNKNIELFYLLKTDHSGYSEAADRLSADGIYHKPVFESRENIQWKDIRGAVNARRLVNGKDYAKSCEGLWNEIYKDNADLREKRILLIGTEECMYPALYVGKKFEEMGNTVFSHSTTRSPIEVGSSDNYPLHERYELRSLYDKTRVTFIYDIGKYDCVFIITDAAKKSAGEETLLNAVGEYNDNIQFIRWGS